VNAEGFLHVIAVKGSAAIGVRAVSDPEVPRPGDQDDNADGIWASAERLMASEQRLTSRFGSDPERRRYTEDGLTIRPDEVIGRILDSDRMGSGQSPYPDPEPEDAVAALELIDLAGYRLERLEAALISLALRKGVAWPRIADSLGLPVEVARRRYQQLTGLVDPGERE
jgi:hypothetical protein